MVKRILLIEDDTATARRVRAALSGAGGPFEIERRKRGATALERLRARGAQLDAMLLGLGVPDGRGLELVETLSRAAPRVPLVVLCGAGEEGLAREALHCGAHDYVRTHHVDAYWLPKTLASVVERAAGAEALFLERQHTLALLEAIGDGVIRTDAVGLVTDLNPIAELMTGWSRQDAAGRPFAAVFRVLDARSREPVPDPVEIAIRQNKRVDLLENCVLMRRDGHTTAIQDTVAPIHDTHGDVTGTVVVFHDAGDARAMSLRMSRLAQYDHLTGLPNRMLLNDRLTQAIELARRHRHQLALLFVDVDRFKHINDSLGHAVGDELLKSVAQRLKGCVRKSDTVGRLGGDEFLVLLTEIDEPDDAALIADKILVALNVPHGTAKQELHVTVSMGIGLYPHDGTDAETLVQNADIAMLHAKEQGRNSHRFFQADMNVRAVERQSIETDLRRALEHDELELHYQPQIELETEAIAGAEALVRWRHPTRGLLAPDQFVPVAEECGLVVPMGRWVLREVCRQARAWLDAGLPALPLALNVSAVELRSKGLVKDIEAELERAGLEPSRLEIELTETGLMQNIRSADAVLDVLKEMGVRVALDDFGTGYSSLSYLKRFPIDALKIDKTFVRDLVTDADTAAIVSAVIAMGRSLGRRVIAEGVETTEQLEFLRAHECGHAQGYYFARPVAAAEFAALLGGERKASSS